MTFTPNFPSLERFGVYSNFFHSTSVVLVVVRVVPGEFCGLGISDLSGEQGAGAHRLVQVVATLGTTSQVFTVSNRDSN